MDLRNLWTTTAGIRVFTTEPYFVDPENLADFARRVEAIGLEVTVTGLGFRDRQSIRITVAPPGVFV
jgi:hypothetical protein